MTKKSIYKFLDLSHQYNSIKAEIDGAISATLQSTSFIGGEPLSLFESQFAKFTNTQYCIGVGNGTDALEIAIESLDLPPNSEIIVPSNSFIATSEAVTRTGHKVVFADVEIETLNISINTISHLITSKTKAVIVVHLYGMPAPVDEITEFCSIRGIQVIEDCAQAHGSYLKNQHVGSFGQLSTFSFYPGKNLGAYGDGGAVITNNYHLAQRCRLIANHGRTTKYNHEIEGRNSRLDSLQASILSIKLKHLPNWIDQRNKNAKMYHHILSNCSEIILPPLPPNNYLHSYHLFVIRNQSRDSLRTYLSDLSIFTGIHYPDALPSLPPYSSSHHYTDKYISKSIAPQLLSLPIGEHLNTDDIRYISSRILDFF